MPSKSAMFFWVSLFFIVQFAPIPVAAVDAASSFQTQTLPANSPPTSSLGPIVKRDDNKDIKDQHGWMFNNCDPTDQDVGIVSKGRRIVPAVIGNVQAGQEHLKKLLQKNPKNTPDNQKWVVGAKDNNCGLVTCVKDTVIHFCNYNSEVNKYRI
ncbi:hypothetical protein SMACR_03735 [Sordaria macrospora]|uniref:WGS project CABT00000000 data, contig 2.16 n=2 Tax=Sordaria macrospora TaxID=5147 RepID=F7VZT0_SORMK|nr:uncharacterized protein SMAC_03735 [Sordaria macrospora k-hell]KAA8629202.1 hypothetical protein SMACR_03735 [Sordaria macrospora]KAH7631285.1 hypothetical protein B0T09DRAFT_357261 [Sordaria sp. MPI-SDFR-AT-0083]WPJ61628.1 hypothetical protein SMAC4_03735 [Sordaria macrospora]CCC11029.1 unnamed protein product [Sordaria macrospora k-hell]